MNEGKNYQKIKEIFNSIEGVELNDSRKGTFRFPIYPDMKEMKAGIEALNLSVRSSNCLMRAKIMTVRDLIEEVRGTSDLLRIRNCGKSSVEEIMTNLFLYQLACLKPKEKEEYIKQVIKMNSEL